MVSNVKVGYTQGQNTYCSHSIQTRGVLSFYNSVSNYIFEFLFVYYLKENFTVPKLVEAVFGVKGSVCNIHSVNIAANYFLLFKDIM